MKFPVPRWLRSRRLLFLPPFVIGIAVVGFLAMSQEELPRKKATINARPVNVIRATSSNVYPEVVGFGTVTAKRVWTATAQVGGQVVAAHPRLRSGRIVQAGEVLLQIDRRDYELRVGQRSAELAQAKSQVEQIKLAMQSDQASLKIQQELLDVREEDLSRLRQLRQRSAASQTELDAARSSLLQQQQAVQTLLNSLRTAPAKIASAEAALRLAESKVAEAERDLERTTIAAPFHGVLSGVSTEKEQYVAPNQSLFSVMDIAAVEIEAHFSIAQLRRVNARDTDIDERDDARSMAVPLDAGNSMAQIDVSKESQPDWMTGQLSAVVTLQSGDVSMDFTATPIRLTESLDSQTRTLGIIVEVKNDPAFEIGGTETLRPGAYCQVQLRSDRSIQAMKIPRSSLDGKTVLVVDRNETLQRRNVEIAMTLHDHVAVVAGLEEGDLVVAKPAAALMPGDLVVPTIIQHVSEITP